MVGALGGRRRRGRAERPDAEPRHRMIILDRLSVSFVFSRIENGNGIILWCPDGG
jgi:hypothetical protein